MAKRSINNKLNEEWAYAQRCWTALREGRKLPDVPYYQTWEVEVDDKGNAKGASKLVKQTLINPMKITYDGVSYFG